MRRLELFAAGLLLAMTPQLHAEPQVQVVGLFPGAAVLLVDGHRKLVRAGQTGPGGVKVVSADNKGAVLEIEGVQRSYAMSREYNQSAPTGELQKNQLSISRGAGNHYWVAGSIEGHPVQFLVDTGATSVAMNEGQARRLGIDYRVQGRPMVANTAGGTIKAWQIKLDSVKIGSLEVLGVEGAVLEGDSPTEVLLGMSFLSRVRWREENGVLQLESKL
ncbi:TIGR02281 family clan AA aspartic protease [Pseudomonas sp. PDM16]|uniref:retropepsin-like aspartic protease family protein n=1 Tax=Pseudomonas sp. PDM16 TaxID=2769292 RepID=UPI0017872256|nr:TIGR02281 family clan AA aspartic protease [Pseudomonas sp. PDM16]MBD9415752.1 TIGR02281 family clan AA aspartic protease [Pseudomonas sp. PDM16]